MTPLARKDGTQLGGKLLQVVSGLSVDQSRVGVHLEKGGAYLSWKFIATSQPRKFSSREFLDSQVSRQIHSKLMPASASDPLRLVTTGALGLRVRSQDSQRSSLRITKLMGGSERISKCRIDLESIQGVLNLKVAEPTEPLRVGQTGMLLDF